MEVNEITREIILKKVCELFNVTKEQMKSHSRKQEIVFARFMYYGWCYTYTKVSNETLAKEINKNHSTVIYGRKEHDKLLMVDKGYRYINHLMERYLYNQDVIDFEPVLYIATTKGRVMERRLVFKNVKERKKEKAAKALANYTPPTPEQLMMTKLVDKQVWLRDLYC